MLIARKIYGKFLEVQKIKKEREHKYSPVSSKNVEPLVAVQLLFAGL